MMLKNCAVLKLHAVNPRFLNVGEMKIGEKDHFHVIGRERGEWFFYRRIDQKLTEKELKSLRDYNWKIDVTYDVTPSTNIIRAEIPKFQGKFYNEINNITGVRVFPVTFQSGGDVYISVEFTENKIAEISDKILDFVNKDYSYKRSVIYMGPQQGGKPYLLNLYLSMGNSPHDLTFVKTRWSFNGNEATMENEGVFQNMGEFVPKQFVDDKTDELIWKMRSEEIKGRAQADIIDKKNLIVEMKVRSRFFSDFYQSVIKEYCGTIFSGFKCEEGGLTSYYIVEKRAQQTFLRGLQRHWNLEGRKYHSNCLLEVSDFGLYENIADLPF
ncbi:hypothetical protein Thermo_01007 [Thermoplasmatales archaeon]|nr:hypothetical protein Thermo_01007 [Thermoplasmatales archaeon]